MSDHSFSKEIFPNIQSIQNAHCAFWTGVCPSTQDAYFNTHMKAQEGEGNKT